ncbi:MAG: hypothetical protein OHK0038_24010 [Flammeovirgaceae bacterium]
MAKKDKPKGINIELMQEQYNKNQDSSNQETVQNFYSFLHKRNRFYEKDVFIEKKGKNEVEHKQYDIKKIHIFDAEQDKSNPKKIKEYFLLDNFHFWQKTPFYQNFIARHHHNALQLTGGNLLPKVYDNKQKNELQLKPDWRLAVGLGSGSVFETSICLHHVYGFPYIPASAIKGITHHCALENAKTSEDLANIKKIFGTHYSEEDFKKNPVNPEILSDKTEQGSVIFFDAYPTRSPQGCIKADIMNPHYPNYYGYDVNHPKFQPPADYQSPVPIIFLTVENLAFQFMVGLHRGVENENIKLGDKSGDMLSVVSGFLREALQERGIGAKTAVGYGYMKE